MKNYISIHELKPALSDVIETISGMKYKVISVTYSKPKKGEKKETIEIKIQSLDEFQTVHTIKGNYLKSDKFFCFPEKNS